MTPDPHAADARRDAQPAADVVGLRGLARPNTLAPVELDLRRVFWIGIALWVVALLTATVLAVTDRAEPRIVAICAAGTALGFVALAWERRRRSTDEHTSDRDD